MMRSVRATAAAALASLVAVAGCGKAPMPTSPSGEVPSPESTQAVSVADELRPATADEVEAFRAACAVAAKSVPEGQFALAGSDGWMFIKSELRHVSVGPFWGADAAQVSKATKPADADPVPAILDFKKQLDMLGVELVMVPVPPKVVIYPDKVPAGAKVDASGLPPRLDAAHQEFYALLADNGIDVIDLVPELMKRREGADGAVYCKHDTHYAPRACVVIAELLAERIKTKDWYGGVQKQKLVSKVQKTEIAGDLWKNIGDDSIPKESLAMRFVGTPGGGIPTPVAPDRASPVVLLGDSHTLVFQAGSDLHTTGAGLADQLALELGFPVDLVGVRGSGATPARLALFRRGRGTSEYMKAKKLVIWCFTAREFTESRGWKRVPVTRETWKK